MRYMAASDVLVLPSYSEGLPTVLVEARLAPPARHCEPCRWYP